MSDDFAWKMPEPQKRPGSVISLDKQDNNLSPSTKNPSYLTQSLLIFTTQLSALIIPYTICTDAGIFTNVLVVTILMAISTYSITAFEPDDPNLDIKNYHLIKKELGRNWNNVLKLCQFFQFVGYGLLIIFLTGEVISFIIFDKTASMRYYAGVVIGILILYSLVILFSQENLLFKINRLTPIANILFNLYLITLCIIYYLTDLDKIETHNDRMYSLLLT